MIMLKEINKKIEDEILPKLRTLSAENPDLISVVLGLEEFFFHTELDEMLQDQSGEADFKELMKNLSRFFEEVNDFFPVGENITDVISGDLIDRFEYWCFYYAVRGRTWACNALEGFINTPFGDRFDDIKAHFSRKTPQDRVCAPEFLFHLVNEITFNGKRKEGGDNSEVEALLSQILVSEAGCDPSVDLRNIRCFLRKNFPPSFASILLFLHEFDWIKLSDALIDEVAQVHFLSYNGTAHFLEETCEKVNFYCRITPANLKLSNYSEVNASLAKLENSDVHCVLKKSLQCAHERLGLRDVTSTAFVHNIFLRLMHVALLESGKPLPENPWNLIDEGFFQNHPYMFTVAVSIILVCFQQGKGITLPLLRTKMVNDNLAYLASQPFPLELKDFFDFNRALFLWHGFACAGTNRLQAKVLLEKVASSVRVWEPMRNVAAGLLQSHVQDMAQSARFDRCARRGISCANSAEQASAAQADSSASKRHQAAPQ